MKKTKVEPEVKVPNDVNILSYTGARLRIVYWDQLPHLLYKMGDRECWHRITWEEFRKILMGGWVSDIMPWINNTVARNFQEEKP